MTMTTFRQCMSLVMMMIPAMTMMIPCQQRLYVFFSFNWKTKRMDYLIYHDFGKKGNEISRKCFTANFYVLKLQKDFRCRNRLKPSNDDYHQKTRKNKETKKK